MVEIETGSRLGTAVEWAPFRLAAGVTEAMLLEAAEGIQRDFLAKQRGFVRRELLRGPDGLWVDLVHWADDAAAHEAFSAAAESAACSTYFAMITGPDGDEPGAGMLHLQRVRAF